MKASTNIRTGISAWILLLVVALAGCNNPATTEQAATPPADTVKKEVTLTPEALSMLNAFPTPFEITGMLEKAKAGFIFDITNSPDSVGKYTTETSKALNLGVYSADLAYSATYNRTDETGKFLGATNKLADELAIAGVYDQTLLEKVKKFGNKKDSLISLIGKIFSQTSGYLNSNNRTKVSVMVVAGGFAEGIYLAASLAQVAKDNTKIMAVIAGQKETHMKLLTILEAYQGEESMKPVVEGIAKLKPIWGSYEIESGKKIPQQKAVEISDLAESVRISFVK